MTKKRKGQATPSDAAGVGPYARQREHLVTLSSMRGWNVVDGEADIRSWEVRTVSGRVLGTVRELLVDARAGEVVMIDMDLAGSADHGYLPLRAVEIDRARRVVRADSGDVETAHDAHDARDSRAADATGSLAGPGSVRYAGSTSERVIERRPIVEETVVRRREVEGPDSRL